MPISTSWTSQIRPSATHWTGRPSISVSNTIEIVMTGLWDDTKLWSDALYWNDNGSSIGTTWTSPR